MKHLSPQGPTTLYCPACGSGCHFQIDAKVITCLKCSTKSTIESKSSKLRVFALLVLVFPALFNVFVKPERTVLFIIILFGVLLHILLVRHANKIAKLIKFEENT